MLIYFWYQVCTIDKHYIFKFVTLSLKISPMNRYSKNVSLNVILHLGKKQANLRMLLRLFSLLLKTTKA